MSEHIVKIQKIDDVTHDVRRYITDNPDVHFKPGQATEVAINKEEWKDDKRPFTFTSLPREDHLEFTIKSYPQRDGVTDKFLDLKAGDELIMNGVFGAITYQGEGTFIAGGAGVTPFIAIFRQLEEDGKIGENMLIFANKTSDDIIYQDELKKKFGDRFINILSRENTDEHAYGHIDKSFLQKHIDDFDQKFYVCGPPPMIEDVVEILKELGADKEQIVIEES